MWHMRIVPGITMAVVKTNAGFIPVSWVILLRMMPVFVLGVSGFLKWALDTVHGI